MSAVAALRYAQRGWRVLPLRGKVPDGRLVAHGLLDASTDPDAIRRWWRAAPDSAVGIALPDGVLVVDVDVRSDGDHTLAQLERAHGELPETLECETGGGGLHIWLRTPRGVARNSAGALGPGLDTRGPGGYVVVPPSLHASGRRYAWRGETHDIADAPAWLLDLLRERETRTTDAEGVEGERIPEGCRDTSLYSLACALRRRGLDEHEIHATLALVNGRRCEPPVSADDIDRIAKSVLRHPPGPLRREMLGASARAH